MWKEIVVVNALDVNVGKGDAWNKNIKIRTIQMIKKQNGIISHNLTK